MEPSRDLSRLVEIMARLRDKATGCPWDIEQDFDSIRHYTIEEAYEVADAIERRDFADLRVELCSECHPFYTGKQKLVNTGGRIDRFERRYGKRRKSETS